MLVGLTHTLTSYAFVLDDTTSSINVFLFHIQNEKNENKSNDEPPKKEPRIEAQQVTI